MTMRPEQIKHYIDGFLAAIERHQKNIEGSKLGTNSWLYAEAGEIYVRPHGLHVLGDGKACESFDFANLKIDKYLRGQGIMMGVIEAWHLRHDRPITYIENVTCARFLHGLRRRPDWIEVDYWNSGTPSFYKPR